MQGVEGRVWGIGLRVKPARKSPGRCGPKSPRHIWAGYRVQGLGLKAKDGSFEVRSSEFRAWSLVFMILGF